MSIEQAFDEVCEDAKVAEGFYVTLMREVPYYGGPAEGGWYGSDFIVLKYKYFATEEAANAAAEAVKTLAESMENEARKAYGDRCLREMDWCDDRGFEADYLPEPAGSDSYYVLVTEGIPESSYGDRVYC